MSAIAEAIILVKLGIISKQILNPEELSEIRTTLKKQMITIQSEENIYELLTLQAYQNGTNIVFNVPITIFQTENYPFFHLIPILTKNQQIIPTKSYIILNQNEILHYQQR